jgi:hypothetical protein
MKSDLGPEVLRTDNFCGLCPQTLLVDRQSWGCSSGQDQIVKAALLKEEVSWLRCPGEGDKS